MTTSTVAYALPADAGPILEALVAALSVAVEEEPRRRITYFDTFDWRLHRAGGCLRWAAGRRRGPLADRRPTLSWLSLDGMVRHRLPAEKVPPFVWDFLEGAFRQALAPVISMRRLLPVVELELGGRTFRILDNREKTVVRLRFEDGTASAPDGSAGGRLPGLLRVLPVRGYDKALRRVVRHLESELGLERAEGPELERALAVIGRQADDYKSKVLIELDPAMPAAEAAKLIHRIPVRTRG